jgi:hypothetical protein
VIRAALVALALALAFVASGCMGAAAAAAYEAAELERMVLLPEDLEGRGWTRFDSGRQTTTDQPSGNRSDPARFGRVDGWKARFRRPGNKQTTGPLVVESRADVFGDQDGAASDFDAYGSELQDAGTPLEELSDLGDRGLVATLVQGDVRFFLVMWRDENAVAAVNLNGFKGKLTREHALDLARKQAARMSEVR